MSTGKRRFLIKMRFIIFVSSFETHVTVCPGERLCHTWRRHAAYSTWKPPASCIIIQACRKQKHYCSFLAMIKHTILLQNSKLKKRVIFKNKFTLMPSSEVLSQCCHVLRSSLFWASHFPMKKRRDKGIFSSFKTQMFSDIMTCDIPLEVWCFPFSASPDIQSSVCGSYAPPVFHSPQTAEHSACGALHSPVKWKLRSISTMEKNKNK